MSKFGAAMTAAAAAAVAACGPSWAPPDAPARACAEITAADYEAAKASGAAWATAKVSPEGVVSMTTGPGVVHCATYTSAMRPCRRPVDFVIRYTLADGASTFVMVPKGETYRFNVQRGPVHCEILEKR